MGESIVDRECWIKLENDLADDLLHCDSRGRQEKYTQVYEKLYSTYSSDKQQQMSAGYLKSALAKRKMLNRIIGTGNDVLDIGCGFGHLLFVLASLGNNATGIDINRIHVREAKEKYGDVENIRIFETKGAHLCFPDNSFDVVISTSVFEHLHPNDIDTHLSEVYRVLRSRGKYIFTALTPYVRGDLPASSIDPKQREKHGFHINERTWEEFKDILNKHGFAGKTTIVPARVYSKIPCCIFLVPVAFKAWLEKRIRINKLTTKVFTLGWVFIIAEKTDRFLLSQE